MANLTLRLVKGSALTLAEMDGNFEYFTGSYTNTGTITAQGFVGNLTGSVLGNIDGNVTGDLTGNVTGNVVGDVTGSLLGNVTGNVTGNADTATTASYVAATDVDGTVTSAATASYVVTAFTASYVDGANVDGYVALATDADLAATASYVAGANVDGDVASATTSFNLDATSGEVVLPTAAPGSPVTGSMYFDSVVPALYIYDGSTWLTGSLV
jgi:hypothetical protein